MQPRDPHEAQLWLDQFAKQLREYIDYSKDELTPSIHHALANMSLQQLNALLRKRLSCASLLGWLTSKMERL